MVLFHQTASFHGSWRRNRTSASRSSSEFCMGVPVTAQREPARSANAARAVSVAAFLMVCACAGGGWAQRRRQAAAVVSSGGGVGGEGGERRRIGKERGGRCRRRR
jgi:hypothetical protein